MNKLALLLGGIALSSLMSVNAQTISSPDGQLTVNLYMSAEGTPMFNVEYANSTVISKSPLGLQTSVGDFTKGLKQDNVSANFEVSQSYDLPNAKKAHIEFKANEQTVSYSKDGKPAFDVTFHVDNNNVAFRYQMKPQRDRLACIVNSEATTFTMPTGTTTFLCPQMTPQTGFARTAPSYETFYEYDANMGTNGHGRGFTFPALFKVNAKNLARVPGKVRKAPKVTEKTLWVMLCETGVDGKYCASRLSCTDNKYSVAYPEETEFGGVGSASPAIMLPGYTPWRTITVGETLAPIAETTIMWDLVKPMYKASQTYKYGRATWSWIIRMDASCNYKEQQEYIDFASKMGYEYVLIDALWDTNIGYEKMEQLVRYAKTKNVGVYLWYNSTGYWNDAPQGPRGKMHRMLERRQEMAWLKKAGVKGLKIDFIGSDKQQTMQMYEDILIDANDYGLEIIYHGCTLPRGWERMYPNFISCEAVRASENFSFGQHDNDIEALAATIHPVLRNAVGNMDFGGSALNKFYAKDNQHGRKRITSDVYALATAVLFQTPVQNFALAPNNLEDAPAWAIDFMKAVPTTWKDVKFIDGYPGKYILLARQATDGKWYVAGVNATSEPLKINVSLPMFEAGQSVQLYLNNDVKTVKVSKKQNIAVAIPSNGGVVIK
ncbi:MAG: glycoside hydrolase family 97 catalytic domain-containing protein [Bacteroidaceae bacterium]|nr:glycoside hydrolase family 97 catalytic domain-containing protein [Bacteroidaceae bacterium]